MATSIAKTLGAIILPRGRINPAGTANTPTFSPTQSANVLTAPTYRDHTTDLVNTRTTRTSKDIIQDLMQLDPDVSAATGAYLTVADTPYIYTVHDAEGNIDREGWKTVAKLITNIETQSDYTLGFQLKRSLYTIAEELRYMTLARGGIASELVMDKFLLPTEVRVVDLGNIEWYEPKPGQYKPKQKVEGNDKGIDLDVPTFFVSFFRRDPTKIYTNSTFVSAINTIAARQLVINELFRIMTITGYPRIHVEVLEEVLLKNAPADIRADKVKQQQYVQETLTTVANSFGTLRSDQPFATTDSISVKMVNEKAAGAALDISHIINVLNAQNQAALKVVATIIGRGESGVNTASVEARIFSMNADDLNDPIAEMFSNMFTLALRLQGSASRVTFKFLPAELRPDTELEPQLTLRQDRILTALSHGLITDEEAHLWLFNRLPPEGAPVLSGTGFYTTKTNAADISSNSDPLGRSLSAPGSKAAKSNDVGNSKK